MRTLYCHNGIRVRQNDGTVKTGTYIDSVGVEMKIKLEKGNYRYDI